MWACWHVPYRDSPVSWCPSIRTKKLGSVKYASWGHHVATSATLQRCSSRSRLRALTTIHFEVGIGNKGRDASANMADTRQDVNGLRTSNSGTKRQKVDCFLAWRLTLFSSNVQRGWRIPLYTPLSTPRSITPHAVLEIGTMLNQARFLAWRFLGVIIELFPCDQSIPGQWRFLNA